MVSGRHFVVRLQQLVERARIARHHQPDFQAVMGAVAHAAQRRVAQRRSSGTQGFRARERVAQARIGIGDVVDRDLIEYVTRAGILRVVPRKGWQPMRGRAASIRFGAA